MFRELEIHVIVREMVWKIGKNQDLAEWDAGDSWSCWQEQMCSWPTPSTTSYHYWQEMGKTSFVDSRAIVPLRVSIGHIRDSWASFDKALRQKSYFILLQCSGANQWDKTERREHTMHPTYGLLQLIAYVSYKWYYVLVTCYVWALVWSPTLKSKSDGGL